jgi:hypothetical protein
MPTHNLNLPAELLNWPIELLKIVEPEEAERLCSLSWDSIRRNHPDKIVHLSKRRVGMRIGHALMLGGGLIDVVRGSPFGVGGSLEDGNRRSLGAARSETASAPVSGSPPVFSNRSRTAVGSAVKHGQARHIQVSRDRHRARDR